MNEAASPAANRLPTESTVWSVEYNRGQEIDWDLVAEYPKMETRKAILWMHGLNPQTHASDLQIPPRLHSNNEVIDLFARVEHLLELAESEGLQTSTAADWAAWAETKGYPVHSQFSALVAAKAAAGRVVLTSPSEQAEFLSAWWDSELGASDLWAAESITAQQAAMALCGLNPATTRPDEAERMCGNGETTADDYSRLLFIFQDKERAAPANRVLADWLDIARDKKAKYHSWVETWSMSTGNDASSAVERSVEAEPPPLPTPKIAAAFGGIKWSEDEWSRNLGDGRTAWILSARKAKGRKGVAAAMWNPVALALSLIDKGIAMPKLDAVFKKASLREWRQKWERDTEVMRD